MVSTLFRSIRVTLVLTVLLCGAYPLAVFLTGRLFFPAHAEGDLITRDGKTVGARLIGQGFSKPEYFHGRPSAAGEKGYDAASSSGSNLGPTSEKLSKAVGANVKQVLSENPGLSAGAVPVDLVTASASGLDPHISPASALVQVDRVAKARSIPREQMEKIVHRYTEERQWVFLGEPVVNVLLLNLELDRTAPLVRP